MTPCLPWSRQAGAARAGETALLASAARMAERSQHRVTAGQDGRSEVFLVLAPCKHDRLGTRCLEELVNRQQRVRDGRRIVKLV